MLNLRVHTSVCCRNTGRAAVLSQTTAPPGGVIVYYNLASDQIMVSKAKIFPKSLPLNKKLHLLPICKNGINGYLYVYFYFSTII